MENNNLIAGSPISISDVKLQKGHPISFKTEFILMPEFELPEYFELNLQSYNDDEKRDEISEILLEKSDIKIPDEMVEQEMELTGIKPNISDVVNWEAAKSRVALLLILRQIAEQDGIEVDERDVKERIELVAKQNATTASALKQMLLPNGGLSRLTNYITAEKVLEYIIENN
jgi:FKBP-type peptidyl-prolyl cis-trans isomerase (trigger factor)